MATKAVIMLIDNSSPTINGDFYPSRIEAQKVAVDRLSQHYLDLNLNSQIAIATIGSDEFGIRSSFTSSKEKLEQALQNISTGGKILIEKGVRSAFLSLNHCGSNVEEKHIIIFIGSIHDLTKEKAQKLNREANQKQIILDVVVFGLDPNDIPILKLLYNHEKGSFVHIPTSPTILSDSVLSSKLGFGQRPTRIALKNVDTIESPRVKKKTTRHRAKTKTVTDVYKHFDENSTDRTIFYPKKGNSD
ncbi:26S proteasome regulatory subunit rpn10-related protein [Histomonas meleagridis]|uniref:26S proteasome regulatory subunit rpn10-related protein n=1 Tax=Histomonas meleagridis TaxID=135588 RepID=UPI003559B94C|nr:26S proteasome regulatory subunit rpn10-related protein [Histomonas meleagridis]KAH0797359.1 26S proteasome regulatory subunit rpn10-related protein [Histomonas meleagridis]